MINIKYGFGKEVLYSFDDAIKKVTEELQKEGFGVLTNTGANVQTTQKSHEE